MLRAISEWPGYCCCSSMLYELQLYHKAVSKNYTVLAFALLVPPRISIIGTLATAAGEDVFVERAECGAASLAFDADSSAAEEGNIPSKPIPSQKTARPGKSNPPAAAYAPASTPPITPPFPLEAPSHGNKSQHVASAQLDASGSSGAKGFVKTPRSRSKDRLSPSAAQRWMTCPPSHRYVPVPCGTVLYRLPVLYRLHPTNP